MNNTFEMSRFARLYKKHTVEHLKSYLLSAAVLAGLLLVCLGFFWYTHGAKLSIRDQANPFVFFYLACGTIFTSLTFSHLSQKKEAIPALMLPASHLEKYLVSLIYTFVVYQLVFMGIYFGVDGLLFAMGAPFEKGENEMINVFVLDQKIYLVFFMYALLHAFAFWGAIYFEKLHFIKAGFVVLALCFFVTLINNMLLNVFIKSDTNKGIPFTGANITESGKHYYIYLNGAGFMFCVAIAVVIITLLLWTTTYFKLKEKEV
jgi:hypothetical protein